TLHMAGNVREWLWNSAGDSSVSAGGAWTDYTMDNWGIYPSSPMDRSPTNGMRLMQTPSDAALLAELRERTRRVTDGDLRPVSPASPEAFAAMRAQFDQAQPQPTAVAVDVVQETELAVVEEVTLTFAAAEHAVLYVVRPRKHSERLQPIV